MRRQERRYKTYVKAKRKQKILKHAKGYNEEELEKYIFGRLRKGKIHCSCSMCKFEKSNHIEKEKNKLRKEELLWEE